MQTKLIDRLIGRQRDRNIDKETADIQFHGHFYYQCKASGYFRSGVRHDCNVVSGDGPATHQPKTCFGLRHRIGWLSCRYLCRVFYSQVDPI